MTAQERAVRLLALHRVLDSCGNTYIREEELFGLFESVVRRVPDPLRSRIGLDRGSLSVAYGKPFDMLVEGNESGDWLGVRDDFRTWFVQNAA
jgi:hypothetical protein